MTSAREIMHKGVTCVGEGETLQAAASRMRELDIGLLPPSALAALEARVLMLTKHTDPKIKPAC
jgi:hypothetical protein